MDSASMVTDTSAHVKWCVAHPTMSLTVIADPELTLSLPPHLTAWTGMDALTHALEAYCVDSYHPQCDGIALESLRMVHEWLPVAFADGSNIQARSQMQAASMMAAVAFQKGLGAVHGISEPIGAVHNTQHGLTNAVLLPHVLRVNRPAIESKCDTVAQALSLPSPPASYNAPGADGDSGFYRVCYWVDSMCARLKIPRDLAAVGVPVDGDAAQLAEKAVANPTGHTNPIAFTAEQYEGVFRAAMEGRRDNYETF
jgi:alcohol dehydrogenase class IV